MESLPQLRMIHRLGGMPPRPDLPFAYVLRQAEEDDAEGLASLLSGAFDEPWNRKRVNGVLLENAEVRETWVVESSGCIVATASLQIMPEAFALTGWVHYVGADARHSGKGLGLAVTYRVLQEVVSNGSQNAMLTTDDWRLAAIKTYLKLGFEPDPWHFSHETRWQAVLGHLKPVGLKT